MEFEDVRGGHAKTKRVWEKREEEFPGRGRGPFGKTEMKDMEMGTQEHRAWESLGERKQVGVKSTGAVRVK